MLWVAVGQAYVIEFKPLDTMHGGEPEWAGVVAVHRITSDLVDLAALLCEGFRVLLAHVVGSDSDAGNMACVGQFDLVIPTGDVFHFFVKRFALLE